MKMPDLGITTEEWIIELEKLGTKEGGEGLTMREIIAKTGWSVEAANSRIRKALESGVATATKKRCRDMSGRVQRVPSYVIHSKKVLKRS
jgi:hypothetical protein